MPHAKMPSAYPRTHTCYAVNTGAATPTAIPRPQPSARARGLALLLGLSASASGMFALTAASQPTHAAQLPAIRIDNANRVPRCVTPERLMAFLTQRNTRLDPRFRDIAKWYRHHGENWRVRWDFAFFQMALETNYLSFRRPDGRAGDVDPRQNNFAGIGATGGGVPGDRFPDVGTGVLAQIQHLVAYSGELLAQPVAQRTALKQDVIVNASRKLKRPVRFSDLAQRWAADPRYASSIADVASSFYAAHCAGREATGLKRLSAVAKEPTRTVAAEPHMQHLLGAADAARATAPTPPLAKTAAPPESRTTRVVARTIWRRGDGEIAQQVTANTTASAAQELTTSAAPSAMLAGLATVARNVELPSVELPIVPPRPQLALRQGR